MLRAVPYVVGDILLAQGGRGGAARLAAAWAPWGFALGSAALYFVLLAVTQRAFQRQPTTELVLFVAWLGMEAFCALALGCAGEAGAATLVALLAVAGFAVSLVCYVLYYRLYYRLGALASFVDGCVPLALIGVVSAVVAGCIAIVG